MNPKSSIAVFVAIILACSIFAPAQTPNNARMLSGVNYQVGTTYTFVAADATRIVSFSNAVSIAATLPAGGTTGFGAGTIFSVSNRGAGTLTITCSSCTISGGSTLVLATGQSADIYSDGTNYVAATGVGSGGGGGNLPAASAAGQYPNSTGPGTTYTAQAKPAIDPRDYGVDCTDTNDSTTAWANAVTAAGNYGKILVPAHCLFRLSGAVGWTLYKVYGLEVEFAGRQGNACDNQGPNPAGIDYRQAYASGNSVVSIKDTQRLLIKNLTIYTNGGADNGILIDQDGLTPPITTRNDFLFPCIYNNTGTRNSSWKGISVSPTSISNVENQHFYHPDITCSASSATSASSNGYAIWFGPSANLKNEIVDDYNAHNCSVDYLGQSGSDYTVQFGLSSNSYINIGLGGFNDALYGFRTENATNAISISNSIGPHLIFHNDFAASAGTIIDCPTGCGSVTMLNNEADSLPANWFNVHSGQGASGPLLAAGNRSFAFNPQDWGLGASVFAYLTLITDPQLRQGVGQYRTTNLHTIGPWYQPPEPGSAQQNSPSPPSEYSSLSGNSNVEDDYFLQTLPAGVAGTPSASTFGIFHNPAQTGITPWIALQGTQSGATHSQITTPVTPSVIAEGTTGATTYTYVIVAYGATGTTAGSAATSTTLGNASLSATNYNQVGIRSVAGATQYDVYRTAGGATQGKINAVPVPGYCMIGVLCESNLLIFNDTGLTGDGTSPPVSNTTGQIMSTVPTGLAPLSISSTTPVANLTTVPATYNHSGTQQTGVHIVEDTCTLGTNCSITLTGAAVFTNSTSYQCTATDQTGANAVKFLPSSGSAFALTGTGTDVLSYVCVGN